jgi:hypothetical protein
MFYIFFQEIKNKNSISLTQYMVLAFTYKSGMVAYSPTVIGCFLLSFWGLWEWFISNEGEVVSPLKNFIGEETAGR